MVKDKPTYPYGCASKSKNLCETACGLFSRCKVSDCVDNYQANVVHGCSSPLNLILYTIIYYF